MTPQLRRILHSLLVNTVTYGGLLSRVTGVPAPTCHRILARCARVGLVTFDPLVPEVRGPIRRWYRLAPGADGRIREILGRHPAYRGAPPSWGQRDAPAVSTERPVRGVAPGTTSTAEGAGARFRTLPR